MYYVLFRSQIVSIHHNYVATDLPDNIVKDIISKTDPSLLLEKLDPSALALPLQQQDLITEEEASVLVNERFTSQQRCRSLFINYLPRCGPSPSCAFRLYKALLDSSNQTAPTGPRHIHVFLAQKVRLYGEQHFIVGVHVHES